jgi:hypothetical protein
MLFVRAPKFIFRCLRKIAKATVNFLMSVSKEILVSQSTDFCEILYSSIFRNPVENIYFYQNLTNIKGTLHEDL